MKLTIKLLIIIFFSLINSLFSQTPPYYNYTSKNGLASNTVYDIIQARNGYIWIATSNGISRFDGHRFKNYGIKEGTNSNAIMAITEGDEGELYIANYEKGINILKDGKITNYTNPDEGIFRVNYIYFEQNKLFGYGSSGLKSFSDGRIKNLYNFIFGMNSGKKPGILYKIDKISDGTILASTSIGFYSINDKRSDKIEIEGFHNGEIYCIDEYVNGDIYAGSKGVIYQIRNYKVLKSFNTGFTDEKVTVIMTDSRGNVWFSIINRGFFVIPAGTDKIYNLGEKIRLQKIIVNDFLEDKEGNIWLSTMGKGVFCLKNLYLNNYSEEDGLSNNNVQAIVKDKNGMICAGTLDGISILDDGEFRKPEIGNTNFLTNSIQEMKLFNDKIYVCISFSNRNIINRFYKGSELVLFYSSSFCTTNDSNYFFGDWANQIFSHKGMPNKVLNEDIYFTVIGDDIKENRVNKMFEDSQNNLWIGTTLGLCRIKDGEKKYYSENEILNSSIKSIVQDNRNRIWFAGAKGIAYYNPDDSVVNGYKSVSGYDLSSSTSLAVDRYNRIWIGNMKGLYILDNNSIKFFNSSQSLPSNEVFSLYYNNDNNVMWIGTSSGLSSFDINLYDSYKYSPVNIIIDNIKAGDSTLTKYDNLEFEHENNNIHISYSVINYSSPSDLVYQYKLKDVWINTENDFLDFKSMDHGIYDVSFRAKTQNGKWSEPSLVKFIIKPKFTETILFRLLILIFIVVIVVFTSKYRLKLYRKKNALKTENSKKIHELEHQALSAMMNPHFIFNSLNSVQYLVNKDRNEEANDYISIMAKLIRKNLDTAGNSFILLDEEINRLTLYLKIEKLRFQDKFSYEINAGEDVDIESIMIPNMILQPFVENAVWYGIMNLGKKGFVKISFRFENVNIESNLHKCLVIKITDNGIGLKKSSEKKKEGHISKGIRIIEERLQLLSQNLELPAPVIIEDLSLRNENSTGTEVIITLPEMLYKNISEDSI